MAIPRLANSDRSTDTRAALAKVPEVTLGFWLIKILATTLGETGGDSVSMSMGLGYLEATVIFAAVFGIFVLAQVRARRFHPWLYWSTIVATTTVGTTLADFADRSLGIGYTGGASLLLALVLLSLFVWRRVMGSVAVASVDNPKAEVFYWVTIMFSQTLGTALGDWTADSMGAGYIGAAAVFAGLLSSIVVYALAVIWVFAVRTATRAWAGLLVVALPLLVVVWATGIWSGGT